MRLHSFTLTFLSFFMLHICYPQETKEKIRYIEVESYTEYYKGGVIKKKGTKNASGQFIGDFKSYYPSGKISAEVRYVKGVPHGQCTHYAENGAISAEGSYIEGNKEGLWTYKNYMQLNGVQYHFAVNYKNGHLHGETILYRGKQKNRVVNAYYGKPSVDSKWEMYYDNGRLGAFGTIDGNHQFTLDTVYDADGKVSTTLENDGQTVNSLLKVMGDFFNSIPIQENRVKTKLTYNRVVFKPEPHIEYYPNGKVHKNGFVNANNQFVDTLEVFNTAGTLIMKAVYDDGIPDGPYVHYKEDGSVSMEGRYLKGKKDGLWKYHNYAMDNGIPFHFSVMYKNGLLHGQTILYRGEHKSQVFEAYMGNPGIRKKWETYYSNGELAAYGYINEDHQFMLHGVYDEKGKFSRASGSETESNFTLLKTMRQVFNSIPK